jgi:hypothetical protein
MKITRGTARGGNVRKYGRLAASGVLAAVLVSIGFSSPAQAATNPYTPQEACHNDFGGSWSTTTDGHRSLLTSSGSKWGDVYLMYNSATGYNCVTTIKSAYVGTPSFIQALIWVQGDTGWTYRDGNLSYYQSVQKSAVDKCVMYWGYIQGPNDYTTAYGGRNWWGNCG